MLELRRFLAFRLQSFLFQFFEHNSTLFHTVNAGGIESQVAFAQFSVHHVLSYFSVALTFHRFSYRRQNICINPGAIMMKVGGLRDEGVEYRSVLA